MNESRHYAVLTPIIAFLFATLLAGCATGPRFDTRTYSTAPTPAEAAIDAALWQGNRVLWGGMVLNSANHENGTEIEVLAYPLASGQRPDTNRQPIGRFIVFKGEYLETVDFAEGRLVTVAGPFTTTRDGRVGDARYVYPQVDADELHLWPAAAARRNDPQFSIGVGVLFGR